MLQRRWWLSSVVLFAVAGPALGQTAISFLDAQGGPVAVYLEGERAWLRAEDAAANLDGSTAETVPVSVTATLSGDFETVQLDETGPDTGVFAGSIQLSLTAFPGDGLLGTSRDVSHFPATFDTVTAVYGGTTPSFAITSAGTVGSTLAVLDASGNEVGSFLVGDTVHFRLRDALANGSPGVDTTWVDVLALVRGWGEYQIVNMTETGGDTGVFEGSVPTAYGIAPTQHDGVVELEPGDLLDARHNDANGQTYSSAGATALSDLPVTIEIVHRGTLEPVSEVYEFTFYMIRVTDGAAAGQGSVTVLLSSDLRGDEERVTAWEGSDAGTFYGFVDIVPNWSANPPTQYDGWFEVAEIAGPPHRFDTVRATLETCSVSPCPTDAVGVIGSSIRFLDDQGEDAPTYSAGDTLTLEVTDFYTSSLGTTATLVSESGDAETVAILPHFAYAGLYRGSIVCEEGPPVPGDGRLQVREPDTITASHLDPVGFSSATDTARVGATTVEFLDRFGNPADFQFENAWARVRVTNPGANLSPVVAESLAATLQTVDADGNVRDEEPFELGETGPDTGVFTGQRKLSVHYSPQPNDGRLDSWYKLSFDPPSSLPDDLRAIVGTESRTVPLLRSKIWFVDADGADATQYPAGGRIYIRVEREGANFIPTEPDTQFVVLMNPANQDVEYPLLTETGPDTSIFEGSFATNLAPALWDGILNVQPGHTIKVIDEGGYGPYIEDQASILGPLGPDALDDAATTAEDAAISIPVLANDLPAGLTLSVSGVTQGAHGTVAINPDGTVSYAPAADYNGADAFTYTADDGNGGTDIATVAVTVTPVNDPPVAVDDTGSGPEDSGASVFALANDSDPEGGALHYAAFTHGAHGIVGYGIDNTLRYTPETNFNGTDAFTYTVEDPEGARATATVTVTITPANDPPKANDDELATPEDTPVAIQVLANDTDIDGDLLTVFFASDPNRGDTAISADGKTVTYTPGTNLSGLDLFVYDIRDPSGRTSRALVRVTVTAVQDPPVAGHDAPTTQEDTPRTIDALANDSDPDGDALSIAAVTQPETGSAVITADNKIAYTPAANFFGIDRFNYTISDGHGNTSTNSIWVLVTSVNDLPNAVDDAAATNEDTAVIVSVLANDSDVETVALTLQSVTQPAHGSVAIGAGNKAVYTPAANYNGPDAFTYVLSDNAGGTDTATVTLSVNPVNDAPDAVNESATTNEDAAVTISVLANDTDPDGENLSIAAVTQGARGAVTVNGNGTLTYTPSPNTSGADAFTYTARDAAGSTDTATVAVNVAAVNDPPDAVNDAATTNEDAAVTISVLANDTDPDGENLSIAAVTQGTRGAVTVNGNGTLTYTPSPNTSGADAFTYTARDAAGSTDTATVAVNVAAVNDPPDAVNDAAATREGVAVTIAVLGNDTDLEGHILSVASAGTPTNGTAAVNGNNTITYSPGANFGGVASFTYTIGDGQGGADTATVTVTVSEALERVAVLATNSVYLQTGSDVLSGDVVVNQASAGPFLNGGVELYFGGTTTTPAGWDVQADSVTIASGATVASDLFYNQLTNNGTATGPRSTPLALPVFVSLPAFLAATPGSSDVSVAVNGTQTLAAGSYRDLIVGRKGTVTFTGGVYHFRTIQVDREAKLLFSAASEVRVQQKLSTKTTTTVGPAAGAPVTAAGIVFHVAGVNGTSGGLAATPKAVEVGTDNVFNANLYAPNGTIWLQQGTQARGAFLGRDVNLGIDVQVTLQSAW